MKTVTLKPHILDMLSNHASTIISAWMMVSSDHQIGQHELANTFGVTPREIMSFLVLELGVEKYKSITKEKRQWVGRKIGLSRKKIQKDSRKKLSEQMTLEMEDVKKRRAMCTRLMDQFTDDELQEIHDRLVIRTKNMKPKTKKSKHIFFTLDDY